MKYAKAIKKFFRIYLHKVVRPVKPFLRRNRRRIYTFLVTFLLVPTVMFLGVGMLGTFMNICYRIFGSYTTVYFYDLSFLIPVLSPLFMFYAYRDLTDYWRQRLLLILLNRIKRSDGIVDVLNFHKKHGFQMLFLEQEPQINTSLSIPPDDFK